MIVLSAPAHAASIRARARSPARAVGQPEAEARYASDHHMPATGEKKRKASLPETVGAWLRVWTPPRDVEVPPVPVRELAIGAVALLLVVAGRPRVVRPAIDDAQGAHRGRRGARARSAPPPGASGQLREQRPRRAARADLRPRAGAPAARVMGARAALLARAEQAISADARQRAAAGELAGARRDGVRAVSARGGRRPRATSRSARAPTTASCWSARSRRPRPTSAARSATRSAPCSTSTRFRSPGAGPTRSPASGSSRTRARWSSCRRACPGGVAGLTYGSCAT